MKANLWRLAALWLLVVIVHVWLVFEAQNNPQTAPFNDVNLYGIWADGVDGKTNILGLNQPWVYPFVAMGPILLAKLIGGSAGVLTGWLILIGVLNLIALSAIVDWGQADKRAFKSAFYYLGFLALLGPVAIGRIDAAAAFCALLGLVQVYRDRLRLAMVFFTLGTWIKIWPLAAALSLVSSAKQKLSLLWFAVATTLALLGFGLLLGGNENLFSFVTTQGNRGLQVESTAATFWVWAAHQHLPGAGIYFDATLVTNQVSGALANETANLLSFVMCAAIAITLWLAIKAFRAGANQKQLFVVAFLTATLDLIVFNKVGSPQFEGWLAAPLMGGILLGLPKWRLPLVFGLAIALLTNLIYPIFYMDLMVVGDLGVWLLTLRNAALVALLVWSNLRLTKLGKLAN